MTDSGSTLGSLSDTYVAAIQHDLASLAPDETLVGVVRRPTGWFHGAVDENVPALAPPADLLEETKRAETDLKRRGICDEEAHNAAWDQVGFSSRYEAHLDDSADARAAIDALVDRLHDGESITLVCFENTAKKRCHRTTLRERIEDRLERTA
ncbi:DUF488 family protein [Halovivax cerinus]|uniref:DUF488 family protein n=1 Tax=Halovivax cerinus TaxID=1487865 RepID=A0ABD5NML8_9EURY|nr:DUF488 family protein [Halovivax cerinus]